MKKITQSQKLLREKRFYYNSFYNTYFFICQFICANTSFSIIGLISGTDRPAGADLHGCNVTTVDGVSC
jgi:hypothetical protein